MHRLAAHAARLRGRVAVGGGGLLLAGSCVALTPEARESLPKWNVDAAPRTQPSVRCTSPLVAGIERWWHAAVIGVGEHLQRFALAATEPASNGLALLRSAADEELERALAEAFGTSAPSQGSRRPPPVRQRSQGSPFGEGGRTLMYTIIGLNVGVFGAFQLPPLHPFLMRWFTCGADALRQGPAGLVRMLTCTYAHSGLLHLAFNMMAFHSFAPHLLEGRNSERTPRLSPGEFLALYTASGVASSLSSSLFFRSIRNNIPALGASGSIFAILTYFCLMHPDAGLLVMFVLPIQASTGLLAVTGVNLALVARAYTAARRGASGPMIDGMAHLGGTAVGALWFWKRRNEERRKAARERSGGGGSRWASSADTSAPPDSDSSTGFVDGFADPFAERSNEGGARGRSGGPGISV